jgi:predicted RNA-binding Zn-ribbon protein involved in translation (DUF1610 family)
VTAKATYEFPIKCLSCGLHYKVFSWESDWWKNRPYCPECGKQVAMIWASVPTNQPIYEHVPGFATPVATS